jgi:aminomethyltransferase
MWTVSKKKEGRVPFIGQDALNKQIADNKAKKNKLQKRVGFMLEKTGVVREGASVLNKKGDKVGTVSSGTFSPVLKKGVGMMYVDQDSCKDETPLTAEVKDRQYDIKVAKMPFVEVKYNRLWDKIE